MKTGGNESCRPLRCGDTREAPRRSPLGTRMARKSGIDDSRNIVGYRAKLMGEHLRPTCESRRVLPVPPLFCCGSPGLSYGLNRREAAACRRHVGADDGGGSLRCSRPLRVFVVSHDTMPIALSPRLCRPCLLAFWRRPMGGSVPLKTVASNYFPRPPAPRLRRAPRGALRSK